MFKKFLPLVVGWLVLMLCGSALAAEPRITNQQQAIDEAKKLLPEMIGDKPFEVDFRKDDYRGIGVWDLRMRGDYPVRNGRSNELNIEIGEDGALLSFNCYDPKLNTSGQKLIDQNKAQEIAYAFLKKMQPQSLGQMKLENTNQNPYNYHRYSLDLTYSFRWNRMVNGIPVSEDGVNINIDAISGQVTHYDIFWHQNATFPSLSDNLKKPEEISGLVLEQFGLYPTYRTDSSNPSQVKAQLVYKINTNAYRFDAVTGKPLNYQGKIKEFSDAKLYYQTFNPEIGGAEIKAEHNNNQQINPTKAQSTAEEFFKKLGYVGKVERSGGGSASGPGYHIEHWNYSIETDQQSNNYGDHSISVSIDTSSGKISGFNNWSERRSEKLGKPVSYEQARTTAEQFVQKELGLTYPVIMQEDKDMLYSEDTYRFCFMRLLHGIPCDISGIYVEVDRFSGEVVSFNYDTLIVSIPKLEQVIDLSQASKIFKETQVFELCYTFPITKSQEPAKNAQLVYTPKDYGMAIDALSGKLLLGDYASNTRPTFNNHWAEGPLRLLAENGLLPVNDFNPDNRITRREALRVLGTLNHYNYDDMLKLNFTDISQADQDSDAFKRAIAMGILENRGALKPEAPLTREQLAVWLIDAIGYKEVANLPLQIVSPFRDIPNDHPYRNHIALACASGAFVGDKDGLFHPEQPVTWAEFATVLTRVTPKINQRFY